ncbi:MAG: hypothetical protein Q4B95_06270 [Lonepinella koalarum]|nr:hypothetical protein [Lonepinella koalarum]
MLCSNQLSYVAIASPTIGFAERIMRITAFFVNLFFTQISKFSSIRLEIKQIEPKLTALLLLN